MNKLRLKTRALILNMLCEGQSMRATARLADVSFNTVAKLLIDAGKVCADLHDELVQDVTASRVQCDEVWSFTYAKQKNVAKAKAAPDAAGDTWTWTALDSDSKLNRVEELRNSGDYLAMDVALRILTQCERLLDKGRGFEPTGD